MHPDSFVLYEHPDHSLAGHIRWKCRESLLNITTEIDGQKALQKIHSHPSGRSATIAIDPRSYIDPQSRSESLLATRVGKPAACCLGGFKFFNNSAIKKKLFFLHIPKTGGSTINQVFSKRLSPSFTHIEGHRKSRFAEIDFPQAGFVSGHVRVFECMNLLPMTNFLRATIVRDPFEHLISHIGWVLYICEDTSSEIYKRHPDEIKMLGHFLQKIDFSDHQAAARLVEDMPAIGNVLFNNCQTRYLVNAPETPKIEPEVAEQAIESLHFFDLVGTQDRLEPFVIALHQRLGLPSPTSVPRENALNNRAGIKRSSKLRHALEPLLAADQILYDYICQSRMAE